MTSPTDAERRRAWDELKTRAYHFSSVSFDLMQLIEPIVFPPPMPDKARPMSHKDCKPEDCTVAAQRAKWNPHCPDDGNTFQAGPDILEPLADDRHKWHFAHMRSAAEDETRPNPDPWKAAIEFGRKKERERICKWLETDNPLDVSLGSLVACGFARHLREEKDRG